MQCSSMSPPDVCNDDPEPIPPPPTTSKVAALDRRLAERTKESMFYVDVADLNEKLELQSKLINSLEGENRLLQIQLSTKENEILAITKEKDLLKKQLTEARQKLQQQENASNEMCRVENCMHLEMLRKLNLEAKTEDISAQIKESEVIAQDLHLKLGNVLVALNALGSGISLLQPKQANNQHCILGLPDEEMAESRPCFEPPEIKIETPETPPLPSSCQILVANQDASSSSSTDVHDSLEVILQSLPPSNSHQTNSGHAPPLSDHEDTQVAHVPDQGLIELTCVVCKVNFKFPEEHSTISAESRESFKCVVCEKRELRRSAKNSDTSPQKSNKIFKCTVCNKVFYFPSKLKNHLRTHTGEKPFHCNVCGKSFSLSFNLKIHYRTHSGERPFMCEGCGKNFRQSKSFLYHNCNQSLRKNLIPCKTCKKMFEPSAFRVHPCVQAKGKQNHYSCEFCGKDFQCLTTLTAHLLTHGEKQAYSCHSCGEAFSLPSDLKRHWCAGTYEQTEGTSNSSVESEYSPDSRIFKCVVCGKSFAESAQLLKHQLIHQSEDSRSPTFPTSHGPENFSLSAGTSSVDSSRNSPINLGKKQEPDLFQTKNLNNRLLTKDRRREAKHNGSPHQQPEFYDISELAMLKSYSDSSTL